MSARARRPASPPLHQSAPRFPKLRNDHSDADDRRAAASKGYRPGKKNMPLGGIPLVSAEWKLLVVIIIVAAAVRLFRISKPNSVV